MSKLFKTEGEHKGLASVRKSIDKRVLNEEEAYAAGMRTPMTLRVNKEELS